MAEAESTESSPAGETKAQKQARIRRERLNKKVQEQGQDRLGKISSLSGRPAAAEADLARASPQSTPGQSESQRRPNASGTDDPAEVDISKMFQRPADDGAPVNQQELFRQMLAATGTPPQQGSGTATPQMPDADDPMVRMMQQMLGGMGMDGGLGGAAGSGGAEHFSQGLASMFSGETQNVPQTSADYLWRIVHGVFSLCLGLYAAVAFTTFSGSELERSKFSASSIEPQVFWIFATVEIVLQSTRYFVDGGKLPTSGILGGLGQMLPLPYAHYVRVLGRYSIICTTIVSDALVIVFVLGCMAWWSGLAPS